jgi:hypothetical protein
MLDDDGKGLVLIEDTDPETKEECIYVTKDPTLIEMYCDRIDMSRGGPPQPRGTMTREERRKNPLDTLAGVSSPVLPHDPCTWCDKGDTNRALLITGDRAFLAWALNRYAGVPRNEAVGMAAQAPEGVSNATVRLCRACAAKTGVTVYSMKTIKRSEVEGSGLLRTTQQQHEEEGIYSPE